MVSSAVLIALVTSRDNTEYHLSQTCFFAAAYWWVGEYEPVARGEVRLWSGTSCVPLMARSSPRPRGQRRTGKMDEAGCEIICGAHKTLVVSHLVSWCLEPSQPQRITSGLNTNFTPSQSYSFHKSSHHKSCLYSAGTQHGTLHPAVNYFILRAYAGTKKSGVGLEKNAGEWTGRVDIRKKFLAVKHVWLYTVYSSMYGCILTYSRL